MAAHSKPFLITWVFVFHYNPSEFHGSIIIVPSCFLKRMLFSFSFSARYALKLSCGNPLLNLSETVKPHSLWEHFQQTALYNTYFCLEMQRQTGLFTTIPCTHTTVFMLLENLSCVYARCKIKNKRLKKIAHLLSHTPSHAATLLLNYIS